MRVLVDTHILLWAAADAPRLPKAAREVILDVNNGLYFSAASIWEIAIKSGLGRADFALDPHGFAEALLRNGYLELSISTRHAAAVYRLPELHKDPFDRVLIAQAQSEDMVLLTADRTLEGYGRAVMVVG